MQKENDICRKEARRSWLISAFCIIHRSLLHVPLAVPFPPLAASLLYKFPCHKHLTASLLLLASASIVSGCGEPDRIQVALPPAQDLVIEAKPVIMPAVLESERAAAEYDSQIEAWGERGWSAVKRICLWAKAHGADVRCD